jgi:hypothetical protein
VRPTRTGRLGTPLRRCLGEDVWANYAPVGLSLPPQGWKIHVSSRLADADRTLAAVWEYCIPRGIAFKFLRNEPGCRPARRGDATVDPRARLACASIRWRAGLPGQPAAPALDGSRHRLVGVLLALGVALHDQPAHLPFFDAAKPDRSEQIHGAPGKGLSEPDKVWKEV